MTIAKWCVLISVIACAGPANLARRSPPPKAPGLEEQRSSATDVLTREYPTWATGIGPVPGRVVALLLPAESRWGRSLEWIGASLVTHPDAYAFGPDRTRRYAMYAQGISPRPLQHRGRPLLVGSDSPWGLRNEAQLAEVEIGHGFGSALPNTVELEITGLRIVEGEPGYPREVEALLDSARAEFDRFLASEQAAVAAVLAKGATASRSEAPVPPRENTVDTVFAYWDESARRLSVLFHRRVMRQVRYSIPCEHLYEGMPPRPGSMEVRYGQGVELAQHLELSADGSLVALHSFTPAPVAVPSNRPDAEIGLPVCPGSAVTRQYRGDPFWRGPPGGEVTPGEVPPPQNCGNGERERTLPIPEACDGSDLGGETCERHGFLGGTLACTERCTLELSGCSATPTAQDPEPALVRRAAIEGSIGALALSGDSLVAIAVRGPELNVRFFEANTLDPRGTTTQWRLPKELGYGLGTPRLAAVPGEFLVAIDALGPSARTLTLRMSPDGTIAGPISVVDGRSSFLVPGREHALLGVVTERTGARIDVVRVDPSGSTVGALRPAITAYPGTSHALATATFTGDGWTVAAGTNGPFLPELRCARVGLDGVPRRIAEAEIETGQVQSVRGEDSTWIVHSHPGALLATELSDAGEHRGSRRITPGLFPSVVAASAEHGVITAWVADRLHGLDQYGLELSSGEARSRRRVLALPTFIPVAHAIADGRLYLLFRASTIRDAHVEPELWLYRGK